MTLFHECVHIRRYDDLAHLLEWVIGAIFVAHPLVGRLRQHIAEARERACDAAVLSDRSHSPADYARLLLSFAEGRRPHRLDALPLSESPSSLPNRLRAMQSPVSRWLPSSLRLTAVLLAVGGAILFGVVACSDSVSPTPSAQEDASASTLARSIADVETPPSLKNGPKALREAVQYPELAREAGIQGKVLVQFVVNEDGTPRDVQVKRSVHRALDSAAVQAVRTVRFEPGMKEGNPVAMQMVLPVTFKLPDASSASTAGSETDVAADLQVVFRDLGSAERERLLAGGGLFQSNIIPSLGDKVSAPDLIRGAGIEGTVEVTFTVGEDGQPQRPRVTKGVHEALDARVLRAIETTTFATKPGTDLTGETVSVGIEYDQQGS
jgi:TonB family protein